MSHLPPPLRFLTYPSTVFFRYLPIASNMLKLTNFHFFLTLLQLYYPDTVTFPLTLFRWHSTFTSTFTPFSLHFYSIFSYPVDTPSTFHIYFFSRFLIYYIFQICSLWLYSVYTPPSAFFSLRQLYSPEYSVDTSPSTFFHFSNCFLQIPTCCDSTCHCVL